jgi:hypothetical protein
MGGVPIDIIKSNDVISFNNIKQTYKEIEDSIRAQKIWGFVRDEIIHYWASNSVSAKSLTLFIAHETGHLNGKHYADFRKEEDKAETYEDITQYSIEIAKKIKKKNRDDRIKKRQSV